MNDAAPGPSDPIPPEPRSPDPNSPDPRASDQRSPDLRPPDPLQSEPRPPVPRQPGLPQPDLPHPDLRPPEPHLSGLPPSGPHPPAPRAPLFLARSGYRQRRLRDGLRLLPFFGAVLLLVPLFWGAGETVQAGGPAPQSNADALVYLFAVWLVLIGLAWGLARRLRLDPVSGDVQGDNASDRFSDSPPTRGAHE